MPFPVFENDALAVACALLLLSVNRTYEVFAGEDCELRAVSWRRELTLSVLCAGLFEFSSRAVQVICDQRNSLRFAIHAQLGVVAATALPKSPDFLLAAI